MRVPMRRALSHTVLWALALCEVGVGLAEDLLPDPPLAATGVRLERILDLGSDRIIDIANPRDGTGRLFLVCADGTIQTLTDGQIQETPYLQAPAVPADRGMSALAFHPDFAANPRIYVITAEAIPNAATPHYPPPQDDTETGFDNVLVEYQLEKHTSESVNVSTRRELLRLRQPHRLHNMNDIAFGPDGYLYIAVGDGGDTGLGAPTLFSANAQDKKNPYGMILRIDVDTVGPNGRYGIPPDNPGDHVPESFAWGLRNPWRITCDRESGHLYFGSVGDRSIESVYRLARGANYGWDAREGTFLFDSITRLVTPATGPGQFFEPPLAEYDHHHSQGPRGAVIGGYVYRGTLLPELIGKYLFLDWLGAEIMSVDLQTGELHSLPVDPSGAPLPSTAGISWGEDDAGELYIGGLYGGLYRVAGPYVTPVATDPVQRALILDQNAPNPFNPSTTLSFELPQRSHVRLSVYDVSGRQVVRLLDESRGPGRHVLSWNGKDAADRPVVSGTYLATLSAGGTTRTIRMVLVR